TAFQSSTWLAFAATGVCAASPLAARSLLAGRARRVADLGRRRRTGPGDRPGPARRVRQRPGRRAAVGGRFRDRRGRRPPLARPPRPAVGPAARPPDPGLRAGRDRPAGSVWAR